MRLKCQDAIHSARLALDYGIVKGGGVCLALIASEMPRDKDNNLTEVGTMMYNVLQAPHLQILDNMRNKVVEQALGRGEIGNQVQLGSLVLQLTGPAQYLGKKNLLAFDFIQMQISLFGRVLVNKQIRSGKGQNEDFYDQSIAKLPFFAFFLVTADFIAARGRGGGLAVWIRE